MIQMNYTGTASHFYKLLTGKDHPKTKVEFKDSLLGKEIEELEEEEDK